MRTKLEGSGKEFPADPAPFAHVLMPWTGHTSPVVMIPTMEFEVYDDAGWRPLDPPLNWRLKEVMDRHLHDPTYHDWVPKCVEDGKYEYSLCDDTDRVSELIMQARAPPGWDFLAA